MKIIPIKIESTQPDDVLEIRWNPNNVCNFHCRYCFPGSNTGEFTSPKDLDLIIKNFNFMLKQYKERLGKTKIHLKIAGGEPTLWRGLEKFILEIKKENDVYLTVISNGSRTLRWWKQYGHLIDNVTLSFHVAEADVDHHIAVADTMFALGKKTTVVVLMDPTRWDDCVAAIEKMKHSQYRWFLQTAEVIEPEHIAISNIKVVSAEERKYSPEQKNYMKWGLKRLPGFFWFVKNFKLLKKEIRIFESIATLSNGKQLKARPQTYINNNWNSFSGWSCNAGLEALYIHWDGAIGATCNQKLYGVDYSYNILDEDFVNKYNPNFVPVLCKANNCFCQPETHISKSNLS